MHGHGAGIHYAKSRYNDPRYPDDYLNGMEDLYIWCKSDKPHAYTNVVFLSGGDGQSGGNAPRAFGYGTGQCRTTTYPDVNWHTKDM